MLSVEELEFLIPVIRAENLFIPAMESYQRKSDDRWPLRLDLCIIWEPPETREDALLLQEDAENYVLELLAKMRSEAKEMEISIWLDERLI